MGIAERRKSYGRNDFQKDRRGIAYHIERAASCGIDDSKTVMHRAEIVPAPACICRKDSVVLSRCICGRLGREVAGMWRYKFFQAYKANAKLKRMMAYYYGFMVK